MRLKKKDIADYREGLRVEQNSVCPLCKTLIDPKDAVLDHCHSTGHIRTVLHRSCNSSEGRVMKWANSSRASDPYKFLYNLLDYHNRDFSDMPLHPNHLTSNEKEIKVLKKKQKKLKTHKARERYQVRIDALIVMEDR